MNVYSKSLFIVFLNKTMKLFEYLILIVIFVGLIFTYLCIVFISPPLFFNKHSPLSSKKAPQKLEDYFIFLLFFFTPFSKLFFLLQSHHFVHFLGQKGNFSQVFRFSSCYKSKYKNRQNNIRCFHISHSSPYSQNTFFFHSH